MVIDVDVVEFDVKNKSIKPESSEILFQDSKAISNQRKGFNFSKANGVKCCNCKTIDWKNGNKQHNHKRK